MTLPLTPFRIKLPSPFARQLPHSSLQLLLSPTCFVSNFCLWTPASVHLLLSLRIMMHFPLFYILFADFRSCSRSKKPKSSHLHLHPRDACVGPAPAAPVMPSPISMALEHSLCQGETCDQNHLLPQREHSHQIVTNINTKDCNKKKKTTNKEKTTQNPAEQTKE